MLLIFFNNYPNGIDKFPQTVYNHAEEYIIRGLLEMKKRVIIGGIASVLLLAKGCNMYVDHKLSQFNPDMSNGQEINGPQIPGGITLEIPEYEDLKTQPDMETYNMLVNELIAAHAAHVGDIKEGHQTILELKDTQRVLEVQLAKSLPLQAVAELEDFKRQLRIAYVNQELQGYKIGKLTDVKDLKPWMDTVLATSEFKDDKHIMAIMRNELGAHYEATVLVQLSGSRLCPIDKKTGAKFEKDKDGNISHNPDDYTTTQGQEICDHNCKKTLEEILGGNWNRPVTNRHQHDHHHTHNNYFNGLSTAQYNNLIRTVEHMIEQGIINAETLNRCRHNPSELRSLQNQINQAWRAIDRMGRDMNWGMTFAQFEEWLKSMMSGATITCEGLKNFTEEHIEVMTKLMTDLINENVLTPEEILEHLWEIYKDDFMGNKDALKEVFKTHKEKISGFVKNTNAAINQIPDIIAEQVRLDGEVTAIKNTLTEHGKAIGDIQSWMYVWQPRLNVMYDQHDIMWQDYLNRQNQQPEITTTTVAATIATPPTTNAPQTLPPDGTTVTTPVTAQTGLPTLPPAQTTAFVSTTSSFTATTPTSPATTSASTVTTPPIILSRTALATAAIVRFAGSDHVGAIHYNTDRAVFIPNAAGALGLELIDGETAWRALSPTETVRRQQSYNDNVVPRGTNVVLSGLGLPNVTWGVQNTLGN
jgi:hypothetical protein